MESFIGEFHWTFCLLTSACLYLHRNVNYSSKGKCKIRNYLKGMNVFSCCEFMLNIFLCFEAFLNSLWSLHFQISLIKGSLYLAVWAEKITENFLQGVEENSPCCPVDNESRLHNTEALAEPRFTISGWTTWKPQQSLSSLHIRAPFFLIYVCHIRQFLSAVWHVDLLILMLFNDDILITELILYRKWVNRGHK